MLKLGLEPLSLADEGASMVGQPLAHYQISAVLGAGGMGVVFKAADTRLGRDVAIKMLAEDFHRDGDRPLRFEREAKLLASLNHPNIAAIHGLEEDQGIRFLVLELVEGETLADRLNRGAIPLDEALKLARQISDALEAAHEKGIIHRDLKPSNIKIAADGTAKVLDFGVAKAFADEELEVGVPGSRPRSIEATAHGVILGTAAYMAPEQARGTRVDKRVDIWAFGAVLYEMVTGTRAFEGATPAETMASVLTKEPDFDRAPARVQRLLRRCLEKEPKNRLRDIADAWELVNGPLPVDAAQAKAKRRTAKLPWISERSLLCFFPIGQVRLLGHGLRFKFRRHQEAAYLWVRQRFPTTSAWLIRLSITRVWLAFMCLR
jgi:serine/threonine-protein kinase